MKKVFCLWNDGHHVSCFEDEIDAHTLMIDLHLRGFRYVEYSKEDFDPKCDCGNENIRDEFDKEII